MAAASRVVTWIIEEPAVIDGLIHSEEVRVGTYLTFSVPS